MIGLLKDLWPIPVIVALCGLLAWAAYSKGHAQAEAEGLATLNALKAEYAEEQRRAADAYGKALAEALAKYQNEVVRAEGIAGALRASLAAHEQESETLRRQIKHVTARSTHTFSPDFVRLCNQYFGAGLPANALPAAGGAGGIDGSAGGDAGAVDARLLSGVNEADLLAWLAVRGRIYLGMKARLGAWQELARGWQ